MTESQTALKTPGVINRGRNSFPVREVTAGTTALATDSKVVFTISAPATFVLPTPIAGEFVDNHIKVINDVTSTAILTLGTLGVLLPGDTGVLRHVAGNGWKLSEVNAYITYAALSKSHSQTNLTGNVHHIEWNTLTGDANSLITVTPGTNQAAGIISIPPGRWRFTGLNDYINSGVYLSWQWENSDTLASIGTFASLVSPTFTSAGNQTQLDLIIVNNTSTFMRVDLFIIGNGGVTSMRASDSTLTIIRLR